MVKLCSFAPGQNFELLRRHLDERGLSYQLRESSGAAELWVEDIHLDQAAGVLDRFRRPERRSGGPRLSAVLRTWPLTLATTVLGICGFLVVLLRPQWAGYATFTALELFINHEVFRSFTETYWVDHQWWRLISPAFLHFSVWHLLFNAMALWELGRRLEFVLPARWYLAVLLVCGVAANGLQYLISGASLFGGLSGVIFGLCSAIAVLHWRTGSPVLQLPTGLYVLAGVSLLLLPVVLEYLFHIHVANGAHFGGLLAGLVLGLVIPRAALRQPPPHSTATRQEQT